VSCYGTGYSCAVSLNFILFSCILINLLIIYVDLEIIPHPAEGTTSCNILTPSLCSILNADPFSIVLTLWASAQLIWVTMLLIVQLVQITRGLTTYEAMQHHRLGDHLNPAENLSTFMTTGATSLETAQLTSGNRGPDPAVQHPRPHRKVGYWKQFQTMLGIDTFIATALRSGDAADRSQAAKRKTNPFSRGWVQNFRDFWCDAQPVFGERRHGEAKLGGETVDYTKMFDLPLNQGLGRRRQGGMEYTAVGGDDGEV
jgi:hypothetical protein